MTRYAAAVSVDRIDAGRGRMTMLAERRVWLAQLPRAVAEKIAYRNAVALFGAGSRSELTK